MVMLLHGTPRSTTPPLLGTQGKLDIAELLYERSLKIDEQVYGPDDPRLAAILGNWAVLLKRQVKRSGSYFLANLPGPPAVPAAALVASLG